MILLCNFKATCIDMTANISRDSLPVALFEEFPPELQGITLSYLTANLQQFQSQTHDAIQDAYAYFYEHLESYNPHSFLGRIFVEAKDQDPTAQKVVDFVHRKAVQEIDSSLSYLTEQECAQLSLDPYKELDLDDFQPSKLNRLNREIQSKKASELIDFCAQHFSEMENSLPHEDMEDLGDLIRTPESSQVKAAQIREWLRRPTVRDLLSTIRWNLNPALRPGYKMPIEFFEIDLRYDDFRIQEGNFPLFLAVYQNKPQEDREWFLRDVADSLCVGDCLRSSSCKHGILRIFKFCLKNADMSVEFYGKLHANAFSKNLPGFWDALLADKDLREKTQDLKALTIAIAATKNDRNFLNTFLEPLSVLQREELLGLALTHAFEMDLSASAFQNILSLGAISADQWTKVFLRAQSKFCRDENRRNVCKVLLQYSPAPVQLSFFLESIFRTCMCESIVSKANFYDSIYFLLENFRHPFPYALVKKVIHSISQLIRDPFYGFLPIKVIPKIPLQHIFEYASQHLSTFRVSTFLKHFPKEVVQEELRKALTERRLRDACFLVNDIRIPEDEFLKVYREAENCDKLLLTSLRPRLITNKYLARYLRE